MAASSNYCTCDQSSKINTGVTASPSPDLSHFKPEILLNTPANDHHLVSFAYSTNTATHQQFSNLTIVTNEPCTQPRTLPLSLRHFKKRYTSVEKMQFDSIHLPQPSFIANNKLRYKTRHQRESLLANRLMQTQQKHCCTTAQRVTRRLRF